MSEKPRLFGTDGVRGVAGEYPLDHDTIWNLARALGKVLQTTSGASQVKVVLGEDTRESSPWISRAVASGLRSTGAEVVYAGVITTPGVAFLTRREHFTVGVMVSASHNPYQDNGIKVFSTKGTKLSELLELKVERAFRSSMTPAPRTPDPALEPAPQLLDEYLGFLRGLAPTDFDPSKYSLVADCAQGAASRVVPRLFQELGLRARIFNREPDGRNINRACGSLHPEGMAEQTRISGADFGVAFDGDADRAIFATHEGRIADGDHVLFALAPHMERQARLKSHAIVGTEMTNLGLELALARQGIGLKRTPVGDKYVIEEMLRSEIDLGGEPSGHIIFSDLSLAGDGIITFLQVMRLVAEAGQSLGQLVSGLKVFPQVIRNVRVREKRPLESIPEVVSAIEDSRRALAERGRIVVRYSGTEQLARVMVEAEEAEAVERHSKRIAAVIDSTLGLEQRA